MANLKDIKRRIGSVKNTQQITRAMKLVAAAKLRRAQEAVTASRPYAEKVMEVMESLAARVSPDAHPLLRRSEETKSVLVLVMSGDKGLCGPFNSNVYKAAHKVIDQNRDKKVSLMIVGKKGVDHFKRRLWPIVESFLDYGKQEAYPLAEKISAAAERLFVEGEVDRVYMVYNEFKNVVVQIPRTVSLLPIAIEEAPEERRPVDYDYEPSAGYILDRMLDLYTTNQVYRALLESAASENGARMTAMDGATKNAKEMIEGLTLDYNRARQAAITTELIEVVTGADALEG